MEALAAGNVCVLKMSEKSVHTTKLLTELLTNGKYVDPRVVKVVNGEANEATELLKQRFDVISYTGGEQVSPCDLYVCNLGCPSCLNILFVLCEYYFTGAGW